MPNAPRSRSVVMTPALGVHSVVAAATIMAVATAAFAPPARAQAQPRGGNRGAPPTRVTPVIDSLHGAGVEDRFRWLESQSAPQVLAWIDAQNRYALQVLGPETPARRALRARLRALLDVSSSSPPRRGGDYEYFTLRRTGEEVAAIHRRRWTPNAGRVVPDSQYERVIDPLDLRADGTTSVAIEALSPDGSLLMYSVRDGGPDETTVKIRDLRSGKDLPDSLPRALYAALSFAPDGRGFYYVHRSRYEGPRYRYHGLGQSPGRDSLIFGDFILPTHFLGVSSARAGRFRIYTISAGWARNEIVLEDTQAGTRTSLTEGADAHFTPQVIDDELWLRTDLDAPRGKLVAVDLSNPRRAAWRTIVAEGEDVLDAFTVIEGKLYVTYLRNASHRIAVFTRDGAPAGEVAVPSHATVSIRGAEKGKALLSIASFTQPGITYALDLATGTRTVVEATRVPFDTAAFEVTQHWYRSKDGTRAPLWVVQKRGHVRSRNTPALLHGYGGFAVNLGPRFDARAALWVERGGIYVQATLRGGNEFGEAWHQGGMLANKQNVFDDFTSAAQFLVDSGFTAPAKLAIRGVSNGGLLMGAALTQRPDLFAAAFVGVPDLDLVRFPWFVTQNNAPALLEYGDARTPAGFEAIRRFSPYQNVRDGVKYPAILVQTGINDTRVPPWQARRFTARLQEATTSGKPVILLHDLRSGHAGGRSMSQNVELATRELEFLLRHVSAWP